MLWPMGNISCDRRKKKEKKMGKKATCFSVLSGEAICLLFISLIPVFPSLVAYGEIVFSYNMANPPSFSFQPWETLKTVLKTLAVNLLKLLGVIQALPPLILLSFLFRIAREEEIVLDSTNGSCSITVEGRKMNMNFLLGWLKRCSVPHISVKRCLHLP